MNIRFSVSWPPNALHIMDCLSGYEERGQDISEDYKKTFDWEETDEEKANKFLQARESSSIEAVETAFACHHYDAALQIAASSMGEKAEAFLEAMAHFKENTFSFYRSVKWGLQKRAKGLAKHRKLGDLEKMTRRGFQFLNSPMPEEAVVHLLANSWGQPGSGSANIRTQETIGNAAEIHVSLMPRYPECTANGYGKGDLDTAGHEFFHTARSLRCPRQSRRFRELTGKESHLIEEAMLDTLCSEGALSLDYGFCEGLKNTFCSVWTIPDERDKDYKEILRYALGKELFPLTREWLNQGKTIFQDNYLLEAREMLEKLKAKGKRTSP